MRWAAGAFWVRQRGGFGCASVVHLGLLGLQFQWQGALEKWTGVRGAARGLRLRTETMPAEQGQAAAAAAAAATKAPAGCAQLLRVRCLMVPPSNCVLGAEEGKAAAAAEADEVPAGVPDFWMVAIRNALEEDAVRPCLLVCFDLKCFRWRPSATH